MDSKTILFIILPSFVLFDTILTTTEKVQSFHHDYERIQQSQIGGIQNVLQRLGNAYRIPENTTFEEFYKEFKTKTPQAIEIQSPNFPKPYPVNSTTFYTISVENSTGIEIIVHLLDINPEKDYLKFIPFNKNGSDGNKKPALILTGKQLHPVKFRLLNTINLQVEFGAYCSRNHSHQGFTFTYIPYGDLPKPTIQPPPVIPFDALNDTLTLLTVPVDKQINSTWELFRKLLCDGTNQWIQRTQVHLQSCLMNNVTFKWISKCPKDWPNAAECIKMVFSITLYSNEIPVTTVNPLVEESEPRYPAGLSTKQLKLMWNNYAKELFKNNGIDEYQEPDTRKTLILTISIGFGLIVVIIISLLFLCRFDIFKHYVYSPSKKDDDNENIMDECPEIDISMIPSPEQVIPEVVERYADNLYKRNISTVSTTVSQSQSSHSTKENDDIQKVDQRHPIPSTSSGGVSNPGFINDESDKL